MIAIIAILAAILFPVFAQAREKARQTTCLSNLQQLAKAQLMYAQDWDEQLPHWWQHGPTRPKPYGPYTYWIEYFQPYLRNKAIFNDPSAHWEPDQYRGERLTDYALLTWGPGGNGSRDSPYWRWAGPPLSLAEISRPSETFNLMDGFTTTEVAVAMVGRHTDGMNAGFLDGHARWIQREKALEVARDDSGEYYYRFIAADRG